jgi:hypothetical protein
MMALANGGFRRRPLKRVSYAATLMRGIALGASAKARNDKGQLSASHTRVSTGYQCARGQHTQKAHCKQSHRAPADSSRIPVMAWAIDGHERARIVTPGFGDKAAPIGPQPTLCQHSLDHLVRWVR